LSLPARTLSERIFRTSSAFRLILFDRLPTREQERLEELRQDRDFYGILQPVEASAPVKAVGRDTALLLLTLREAGTLPGYVAEATDAERLFEEIGSLVMDGVLEVQDGGRFVSGSDALSIVSRGDSAAFEHGAVPELSLAALRYGAALEIRDLGRLTSRLYGYNRVPLTPRRARRFPNAAAVEAYLGVEPGGRLQQRLLTSWHRREDNATGPWLIWNRRGEAAGTRGHGPTYKLYVSPTIDILGRAFEKLLKALSATDAYQFKIAAEASGLLRPDKLVVYFADLESLTAAGTVLAEALAGLPAHGIPFTAEIAGRGLLSWGLDPPSGGSALVEHEGKSWRYWVANRLAAALLQAKGTERSEVEPWRFALERLRRQGVDVDRWVPSATLWRGGKS
jgi:hypothetical protein